MRKVKVTLPATVTDFGVGLHGLGLALALHVTVEIVERSDDRFVVETSGEGAGQYSTGLHHPVVLGLARVFQQLERAPTGLTIRVDSRVPPASGLGVEAAFQIAGIIGANNLFGGVLPRDTVLTLAAQLTRPDHAVTALLGGLTTSLLLDDDRLIYRSLPVAAFQVVVAVPQLDHYAPPALPSRIDVGDALHDLSRLPLLIEALRSGDHDLLAASLDDRLLAPLLQRAIPGFDHVVTVAKRNGASAVAISGGGPALIAFARSQPQPLAEAMTAAFTAAGIDVRTWIVPVDRQGVVLSVAQS